jgi:folate-binding protein YgfZ
MTLRDTIARTGAILDLGPRTLLRFTGPDRIRYLNGQLTAKIAEQMPRTIPACVLTAKGKMCAEVWVRTAAEPEPAVWVDGVATLRESLPARMERYIVADDVTVEDLSDGFRLYHAFGPAAATLSAKGTPSRRFTVEGYDFWLPEGMPIPDEHSILEPARTDWLRIDAGIPAWDAELTEDTLPPEARLETSHIDYHKGCYIGQEVISRLKSVGHVNRTLFGFQADEPLVAGMTLRSSSLPDREAGTITSACADSDTAAGHWIALGFLRRGAETGLLHAIGDSDRRISLSLRPTAWGNGQPYLLFPND